MIRMRDFVATELYADRGVVAGCSLATTFTRAYSIEAYDAFVRRNPQIHADNYINDNVLSMEGHKDVVVNALKKAAIDMDQVVREDLRCRVARRKTKIVATNDLVGKRLKRAAEAAIGGELAPAAADLGIDYAAGRRRARHGAARTAAARLKKGLRRRERLKRVAAVVGTSATNIFTTGAMTSMVHGSEVHGLSDAELLRVERLAAAVMKPKARGRSLNVMMALHNAPTWRAGTAPILQYMRATWRAIGAVKHGGAKADLSLVELRNAWGALKKEELVDVHVGNNGGQRRRRRWDRVQGPLGALFLSLDRIGWSMSDSLIVKDDLGVERKVLEHSPAMWAELVRGAVVRGFERRAAAVWARKDKEFDGRRICLDPIRNLLAAVPSRRRKRWVDPFGSGVARAMVCGAIWTNARANNINNTISAMCSQCKWGGGYNPPPSMVVPVRRARAY